MLYFSQITDIFFLLILGIKSRILHNVQKRVNRSCCSLQWQHILYIKLSHHMVMFCTQ